MNSLEMNGKTEKENDIEILELRNILTEIKPKNRDKELINFKGSSVEIIQSGQSEKINKFLGTCKTVPKI